MRFNSDAARCDNVRAGQSIAALAVWRRPSWLLWTETRGVDWNTDATSGGITGKQINALAGVTGRLTPVFLVGAFGGYEYFNYTSEALNGRLTGDGWTAGAYLGWQMLPGLRFDLGAAHSGVNFQGAAGTASFACATSSSGTERRSTPPWRY